MISGILIFIVLIAIVGGIIFTAMQRGEADVDRGATVRRLYLYLVALVSYVTALFGLNGLLRILAELWFEGRWFGGGWLGVTPPLYQINADGFAREQLARTAGVLVVATLIFLLHWGFIQGRRRQAGEATAALRKLFLYVALGFTLGFTLINSYQLLTGIADLAFGLGLDQSTIWPSGWFHRLTTITAGAALALYLRSTLRTDGDYNAETNRAAKLWRQLYFLVATLAGLTLLLWGTTSLIDQLLRSLLDQLSSVLTTAGGLVQPWSGPLAQSLLGAWLLRSHWQEWQTLAHAAPAELRSAIRRLTLYAAVVIAMIFALTGAALLLNTLLLRLLGDNNEAWLDLLRQNRTAIAAILPGSLAWRWFWQQLQAESQRLGEGAAGDHVRRIYAYTVAAVGLVLLWIGAGTLVQVALDWLLSGDMLGQGLWRAPLANGLSLLAVGAPIWSLHWQAVQRVARQSGTVGAAERHALPRRIYLYGVALIGALVILYYLAQVVYRLFLMLLGEPNAAFFSPQTADEIARSLIAGAIWGIHLLALRTDLRQIEREKEEPSAVAAVAARRQALAAQIMELEQELAVARAQLAELDGG